MQVIVYLIDYIRVESGSDDVLVGQVGLIHKRIYPDNTCSLENSVGK